MPTRRGRPPRPGPRHWTNSQDFVRRLEDIFRKRDRHDPEAVTTVQTELLAAVREFLGEPLTPEREQQLKTMAGIERASRVAMAVLRWKFNLPDRTMRVLQRPSFVEIVDEFIWM
jgi:hypothetical protein